MAPTRFFHKIDGNVRELPDQGPFRYERELQEFFEKHLHTLTGVEFLASEHPTGPRHGRRIDTLGIDGAGRPVVIEYKRRTDQNVINQGLDYLFWLEDHRAEFRELVRRRLGDGRVTDIDFGASRLLCIAKEFPRQDQIAAANSRRPIELLCYRRYGDAYVALEWVGGNEPRPVPPPDIPPAPPKRAVGEDPGYSIDKQDAFLKRCDEHGKGVFSRILDLARRRSMSINWGDKGFSMGVEVDGARVVVCYVWPPTGVLKQRLQTALHDRAGIERKTRASAETVDRLRDAAEATRLFVPAGRELKCPINRAFTDHEVDALVAWCESVAQAIVEHGASAASEQ